MIAEAPPELDSFVRREILADEIDVVITRLDACFSDVVARVEGELFDHAEASVDQNERRILLDAYNTLRSKRDGLERRFKGAFRELLDDSIHGHATQHRRVADELDWTEISLVDTTEIEEDVQVMRLTDCIKSNVEWELRDLNARMSFLLGRDGADEAQNPLRPELFSRALGEACVELESDHQGRMAVMRAFEEALSQSVGAVYHDLNQRLISKQVLPKIRHRGKVPPRPAKPRAAASDAAAPELESVVDARITRIDNAMGNVVESTLGMFDALQQLVGETPAYRSAQGWGQPQAQSHWAQRSYVQDAAHVQSLSANVFEHALSTHASRRNLFAAIAELREAHAIALDLASNHAAIDIAIDIPDEAPSGPRGTNFIRAHRDQLTAAAATPLDRMKIDIVAMLFDHILADDKLPAEIKTLLARLQLPVLRMALADGSFFATRAHPTRRLIDRLASCAVGWRGESTADRKFFAELERVVRAIAYDASDDSALYERLLGEFESFLDRARSESDNIVCRAADVLERAEEREVLAINATIQINQLLYGVEVDVFLRAFLLDIWSHVLVETACRAADPKTDTNVARAKRLCLDLVWSTAPKATQADRKRLVELLPKMIATIRQGLTLIGYPAEQQTRFFAELMKLHSEAVRTVGSVDLAGRNGAIDIDHFAERLRDMVVEHDVHAVNLPDAEVRVSAASARRIIEASDVAIEVVTAPSTTRADANTAAGGADPVATIGRSVRFSVVGDASVTAWIATLEKGNWLELKGADGYAKVRLAWISPMKSFYLFIGADGQRAQSLNPETLHAMFKRGDIRFIEEELLVDRAVRSVMHNLERQKHAA